VPAGLGTELAAIARSEIAATAEAVAQTPAFQSVLRPMATAVDNARKGICLAAQVLKRSPAAIKVADLARFSYDMACTSKNFTFGFRATKQLADVLGKGWVGKGWRATKNGCGITKSIQTAEGLFKRTYRYPAIKDGTVLAGRTVANYQELFRASIRVPWRILKNGHLIIK
jgi:hypothetical protein